MKIIFFCMVKYFSFHNSSFCLKILFFFNVNGKGQGVTHPCGSFSHGHFVQSSIFLGKIGGV